MFSKLMNFIKMLSFINLVFPFGIRGTHVARRDIMRYRSKQSLESLESRGCEGGKECFLILSQPALCRLHPRLFARPAVFP